ncbi:S-methyl-5-thioribose kinase [Saccharothrix sp. NPDC042600]|uniref:S-methyl-5-thioribose kinase n=1 Tax=Saccharothrix TaxID=2071 RepID=UPI0033D977E6|nr:S-methyl-5-thioribose kinase [Saccharothrix mutabilis subsp. capreolus]
MGTPTQPDLVDLAARVAAVPALAERLGGDPARWEVREIGDGNVNFVFSVHGPDGAVCVKQAPPYVRVAGSSWPLSPHRAHYEHRALQEHRRHAPDHVPEPLHHDPGTHLQAIEYLDGHVVLRQALITGPPPDRLGHHLGDYLARTLFHTSDLALPAHRKRALVAEFEGNTEMCAIMEQMVFTEIYHPFHRNRWTSPHLDADVRHLRADTAVLIAVARLKDRYLTSRQALLHGDLHTGSIMVSDHATHVIDQEFACFGPIGFDIGNLLAHLLINYFATTPPTGGAETPAQTRVLETVETVWTAFATRFADLWRTTPTGDSYPAALFPAGTDTLHAERLRYLDEVFRDTTGFCAAEVVRRVVGFARPADFTTIEDADHRATCERAALRLARTLLLDDHHDIHDVTEAARRSRHHAGHLSSTPPAG